MEEVNKLGNALFRCLPGPTCAVHHYQNDLFRQLEFPIEHHHPFHSSPGSLGMDCFIFCQPVR